MKTETKKVDKGKDNIPKVKNPGKRGGGVGSGAGGKGDERVGGLGSDPHLGILDKLPIVDNLNKPSPLPKVEAQLVKYLKLMERYCLLELTTPEGFVIKRSSSLPTNVSNLVQSVKKAPGRIKKGEAKALESLEFPVSKAQAIEESEAYEEWNLGGIQ